MSSQKTLFSYFQKSPGVNTPKSKDIETPKSHSKSAKKTPRPVKSSKKATPPTKEKENNKSVLNEDSNVQESKGCRKRLIESLDDSQENDLESDEELSSKKCKEYIINSEDSGDEYVPDKEAHSDSDSEGGEPSEPDPPTESDEESPIKKKRKRPTKPSRPNKKMLLTPKSSKPVKEIEVLTPKSKSILSTLPTPNKTGGADENDETNSGGNWTYLKYDFLKPEKIRDAKRRPLTDPNYDPRTLYVTDDFLRNQTPGMRQWWEIKSKYFDCVIFFKVGKFYEFYHMDAVTGVKELSLTFMRGEYAHCGFPEIAYGRFSAALVDKGYKVVRIEQTETPDMMAERCKKISKPTKFDRVVAREVCQLTTKGTRIFSVADGASKDAESKYLLAIAEKMNNIGKPIYGTCFIDSTIGTFYLSQFEDDRHSSRLRTLIAKYPPAQVLFERNGLSKQTHKVLNTLMTALKESLAPESEFWTSSTTLTNLAERQYFAEGFPEKLKEFVGEGDSLRMTATEASELGVRALGAVIWCLSRCLLDHQLLSMGHFDVYVPVDVESGSVRDSGNNRPEINTRHMVLDAVTMKNLNVIESLSGSYEGTLIQKLDHCCTPFGKRLLRHWLCNPLTNIKSIEERQKAISVLRDNADVIREVRALLTKVPDLERLLSRIHAQSSKGQPESHPDNRAIMFEEKTYSKKKIMEFISVLNGFQTLQETAVLLQGLGIVQNSEILTRSVQFPSSSPPGHFPDLTENLNFFKNAFDHEEAEKEGRIIPSAGVDEEYDHALETLAEIEKDQKRYLKQQCDYFGCKVTYAGSDKKRFQIEVADSASRKAGEGYELQGQRKGFKKYYTTESRELLERQLAAEDIKINVLQNLRKRIFSKFSQRYDDWNSAIQCVGVLDVLLSLAEYACSINEDVCVPIFKHPEAGKKAFVIIKDGKFPCFVGEDNFIPNDTSIGDPASLLLLTGPNMGGKSTLMRQLGLLAILAQMGCHVPASSMELSVVDRIFTRIGANDDIMAGESTFYLELCETSAILKHATKHSLVLVDELGRGTSTYDGTAIASAVLKELCKLSCRTIFSTHYHSLVEDFKGDSHVTLGHMACMAETDEDCEDGIQETVTFLYKLADGACPKSYGFNAARLAGIPAHITRLGASRAKQLEIEANNRKAFRALFTSQDDIRSVISAL